MLLFRPNRLILFLRIHLQISANIKHVSKSCRRKHYFAFQIQNKVLILNITLVTSFHNRQKIPCCISNQVKTETKTRNTIGQSDFTPDAHQFSIVAIVCFTCIEIFAYSLCRFTAHNAQRMAIGHVELFAIFVWFRC